MRPGKTRKEIYRKIYVIVNNPCLEYWFLLHFENSGRTYKNCGDVTTKLKRYLPGYDKSARYFKKKECARCMSFFFVMNLSLFLLQYKHIMVFKNSGVFLI